MCGPKIPIPGPSRGNLFRASPPWVPPPAPRAKSRPGRACVLLWDQPPQLHSALLYMHATTNHRAFAVPLVTHHRVAHCGGTWGTLATSVVAEKGAFTLFLLLDFACTSERGRSMASHPCLSCYLASGILSSRPPRGVPPTLTACADTDYSTLMPAPHRCRLRVKVFQPLRPEGSHSRVLAQAVLTGCGSQATREAHPKAGGPVPAPGGALWHLPYTSREFCCFSSRTMSTTMARKDASLV